MRFTRASMLEVLQKDYIRTARAKGLAMRSVVLKHTLRNALLPVITVIGLQIKLVVAACYCGKQSPFPECGKIVPIDRGIRRS